jgi:predicted RNA binding protein YcfA (HicA-like mRNA interferase family)
MQQRSEGSRCNQLVESDGWYLARTHRSHRHFKHPQKRGIVTIAGHPNVDIPRAAP